MIFAVPPYEADEPEHSPRSEHISGKDLRRILLVLVLLAVLSIPVYTVLRQQRDKHVCASNFKAMYDAMGIYAELYDDRWPPAFAESAPCSPLEDSEGRPFTWVSLVEDKLTRRASFLCPAAPEEEHVLHQHPNTTKLSVSGSYGMYVALSGQPRSLIAAPSRTALLAETANRGASSTFDPLPLLRPDGTTARFDGFLIGYDDGNEYPSPRTRAVTRLAFLGTRSGAFDEGLLGRHGTMCHFLLADGQLVALPVSAAKVEHLAPGLTGLWSTR